MMELLNLNKQEIEILLNSHLKDFNKTSSNQSELKQKMFFHLKSKMGNISMNPIDIHYNSFEIKISSILITIKISTKSTKKIKKITKLKNKTIKEKDKFKIDSIIHTINHLCYDLINDKNWKISINPNSTSSGDPNKVILTDFNLNLIDMMNPDFLIKTIDNQENNNQFRQRKWKGFKNELNITIAQPIIKNIFLTIGHNQTTKKSELPVPKPYFDKLPNEIPSKDLFNIIVDIVSEINQELINDVIYNKTFTEELPVEDF